MEKKREPPRLCESDIYGDGYGSDHRWDKIFTTYKKGFVANEKFTNYLCKDCGTKFNHYYDITIDIFEAMENAKIPKMCFAKPNK